ncbi:MAG: DNA-processing protein DprA [Syntrophales bacterium]|nr:DNA-processing protein DprA [Syntrophales bacterium]MDD4339648.1 DNA-processing protein DprA [Syntrophales bacterium]HOG08010.1 DNA-processing protein DprA [Syntrophales bacterium]HOS77642.1 DNA-processing protein DprA [Syntrophales bacterium]HPB70456.1 DNA-processing protein DprA [Syntrophales bacterium]
MQKESLPDWLALKKVEGVGNLAFKTLVEALGSPAKVFAASYETLKRIPGIGDKTAAQIKSFDDWKACEKELERVRQGSMTLLTFQDADYPRRLLNIYDFPPLLYVRGTLSNEDIPIAVVGSRQASPYGRFTTERLCRELALRGITVVSGMARGIDSAAHSGALAGRGRTIAVLGSGPDVIYPPENESLYRKIAASGAVISEYPFGTPPNAANFPARNRIISGLSLGVVVVEAGMKSGSLITARIALEQGREVFAVPGAIDSSGSRGTHRLLKEGAKLIEGVDDILEEILPQLQRAGIVPPAAQPSPDAIPDAATSDGAAMESLSERERIVFSALSAIPVDANALVHATGLTVQEIITALLQLELNGLVRQMPGNRYLREESLCRNR